MFKQILTTVCVAAIMSAGSVAYSDTIETQNVETQTVDTQNTAAGDAQVNDQTQGSLSNQSNVGNNSNSNSSNNFSVGQSYNDTSTSHSNSNNTSTSIANTNGYVTSIPIIASAGTCLGSTGTNISAAGIGIGSSTTVIDDACNERQQQQLDANIQAQEAVTRANTVRLLNELGLGPAALSLMCQDPSTRLALKAGLEPVVYNKVCKVYEPDLSNVEAITTISQY